MMVAPRVTDKCYMHLCSSHFHITLGGLFLIKIVLLFPSDKKKQVFHQQKDIKSYIKVIMDRYM